MVQNNARKRSVQLFHILYEGDAHSAKYLSLPGFLIENIFNWSSNQYLPTVVLQLIAMWFNIQLINHYRESFVTEQVDAMVLDTVVNILKPTEQVVTMAIPYSISRVLARY